MKYIRTKDGRLFKGSNYGFGVGMPYKNYDVKVADTVEELCDVIICGNKLFYPLTSNRPGNEFNWEEINRFRSSVCMSEEEYNKIKETTNDFEPYFWNVYGAIWTTGEYDEPILKSVAKMKSILPNGEIDWELLRQNII